MRSVTTLFAIAALAVSSSAAGAKSDLIGDVRTGFTDNHYRLSDEQIADFEGEQGAGERFFGMEDPEDIATRLRLRGKFEWKLGKKRYFELLLRGAYTFHVENDISDYADAGVDARYDVTKKDRLYGGFDLVFDRFWKNYRVPDTVVFAPAVYDQIDATFGYRRKTGKHSRVGIEARHRDRAYDAPLESRDRTGLYFRGFGSYRFTKKLEGSTSLGLGDIEVDPVSSFGVVVDRSYQQYQIDQEFRLKLPAKTRLGLQLQYRVREFQTENALDPARFDREDSRTRLRLLASKELSKNFDLEGRLTLHDNDSDRVDPLIEADEVGYEETVFEIGLRYKFF